MPTHAACAPAGKSADAFQGIVVCLDCEAPLVEALTKKLMLQNVVNINTGAQYSPTMVKQVGGKATLGDKEQHTVGSCSRHHMSRHVA
jgi:hypothetical protein